MPFIRFFIAFLFICWTFVAFGQSQPIEAVYLKNGNVVKGTIVEQVPNVSLKIQTKDGSLFVFKYEEIEKITKEVSIQNTSSPNESNKRPAAPQPPKTRFEYTKTGLWFGPRLGVLMPAGLSVGVVGGWQPNKHLAIGLGASFHQYIDFASTLVSNDGDKNTSYQNSHDAETPIFLPLYFETRVYFTSHRMSPYIFGDIGYSFLLQNNRSHFTTYTYNPAQNYYSTLTSGGTMAEIGGGARMASSNKLAFTLEFGFFFQSYTAKIEPVDSNNTPIQDTFYQTKVAIFPTFKFGMLF